MKTKRIYSEKKSLTNRLIKNGLNIFILFALTVFISSCEDEYYYGHDGRTGDAYLSLTWAKEMPEYIDAGTSAIPPVFKWGKYYEANPGDYQLYYEGSVWNGFGWSYYAWEVDYEIWVNFGESGQPYGIDGRDGADTFLTLECSPSGPFPFNSKKSSSTNKYEIVEQTEDMIKVKQVGERFSIKVTYIKAVHSKLKE